MSRTVKFQIMLSEQEALAIDDWGRSNRIRTRAEAIRRLCEIAMLPSGNNPASQRVNLRQAQATSTNQTGGLLPRPLVRKRYGISEMTMWRWEKDEAMNFPKPTIINRKKFFLANDLEAWERDRRESSPSTQRSL